MVQEVESFSSKLEVDSFTEVCPLHDGQIVVCLEWSSEDVATESTKRGVTGARWIRTVNDNVLIVNAPATRNKRTEVDEIIDPIPDTTRCQDLTYSYRSAAAIDEICILQRKRAEVGNQEWRA